MNPILLVESFYDAFARKDDITMHKCYHPAAHFSDPVFQDLNAEKTKAMWSMLLSRGGDLVVDLTHIEQREQEVHAKWEAHYSFTQTGNKVHNQISAKMEFRDGLIVRHTDHFDLYKWCQMAFGWKGTLIGWAPFFQSKIRHFAMLGLEEYMSKPGGY